MVRVKFKIRCENGNQNKEIFLFGEGSGLGDWNILKVNLRKKINKKSRGRVILDQDRTRQFLVMGDNFLGKNNGRATNRGPQKKSFVARPFFRTKILYMQNYRPKSQKKI